MVVAQWKELILYVEDATNHDNITSQSHSPTNTEDSIEIILYLLLYTYYRGKATERLHVPLGSSNTNISEYAPVTFRVSIYGLLLRYNLGIPAFN